MLNSRAHMPIDIEISPSSHFGPFASKPGSGAPIRHHVYNWTQCEIMKFDTKIYFDEINSWNFKGVSVMKLDDILEKILWKGLFSQFFIFLQSFCDGSDIIMWYVSRHGFEQRDFYLPGSIHYS